MRQTSDRINFTTVNYTMVVRHKFFIHNLPLYAAVINLFKKNNYDQKITW
jgi:hypothetical protein